MQHPPRRPVDADTLRRLFNTGAYWEEARAGRLSQVVKWERTPALATEPPGTRSQVVAYYDAEGRRVAIVHQYLRPDGMIGGSGRPDPKELLDGGILFYAKPRPAS